MPLATRFVLAAALLASPALAEGGISLAVASNSIGVGPVAGVQVASWLGAHGDAALLAVSKHWQSGTTQDIDHLKLRSAVAMVDLLPLGHGLRFSAGARYEGEQAPFGLGPARGRAGGGRGWTDVAPALTLGWTRRCGRGLVAVVEAGTALRRTAPLALAALRASPIASAQLGWRF